MTSHLMRSFVVALSPWNTVNDTVLSARYCAHAIKSDPSQSLTIKRFQLLDLAVEGQCFKSRCVQLAAPFCARSTAPGMCHMQIQRRFICVRSRTRQTVFGIPFVRSVYLQYQLCYQFCTYSDGWETNDDDMIIIINANLY